MDDLIKLMEETSASVLRIEKKLDSLFAEVPPYEVAKRVDLPAPIKMHPFSTSNMRRKLEKFYEEKAKNTA